MPKSWVLSKTLIVNALFIVGTLIATFGGFLPQSILPWAIVILAAINMLLRFITKGEVSVTLPGSLPTVPPIFQAGIEAFEKIIASLPPDLGPRTFQLIEAAARGDYPDGASRLNYVLTTLQTEFPGVGTNTLRTAIEQLLMLKNQGATPKLTMNL